MSTPSTGALFVRRYLPVRQQTDLPPGKYRPYVYKNRADYNAAQIRRKCRSCGHRGRAVQLCPGPGLPAPSQRVFSSRSSFLRALEGCVPKCLNCMCEETARMRPYTRTKACVRVGLPPTLANAISGGIREVDTPEPKENRALVTLADEVMHLVSGDTSTP